jgi:hypothetical protein
VSVTLKYESLLKRDFRPVINTISGSGKLYSDQVTLLESQTFNLIKQTLKLGENYTNTFRNINFSFKIADGRIIVSPFDVRTGNLKMNIGGDHGLDQTLNYFVKTEIPRADLGSSVNAFIDNLTAQASAFGLAFKPSETLKVNLKVSGTFSKPIVAPVFGDYSAGSGDAKPETINQVLQQALDNTVESGKDKARQEAEKQAALLIKEAEDKGEMLIAEAEKAAAALKNEADIQADKLISDASKQGTLAQIGAKKGAETIRSTADKKAKQLVREAENQSAKLIEEAKKKGDELIGKI